MAFAPESAGAFAELALRNLPDKFTIRHPPGLTGQEDDPSFKAFMIEPGYYKTNYRVLRLREMVRWYGWARGIKAWLKIRFKPMARSGRWMPGLWTENECKTEDLSPDFWQATKPHQADFEKLGFVQCHLTMATKKCDKLSDPSIRDSGGIFYLDPSRCFFGQLIYSRSYRSANRKECYNIVIGFTAIFGNRSLACTNHKLAFDSVSDGKVIRFDSYEVVEIYNRFREELQRRRETPKPFADIESLRQWFDARQINNFEDRVRRRLFVRMTEPEVVAAWAERQRYQAGRPPLPRRRFQLEFFPTALVLILLASMVLYRHQQVPGGVGRNTLADDTIDYQGQRFKMRLPYADYEDYKDDTNNLDTNEIPRIEQTMESVKIPVSFKDLKELVYTTAALEFPGYGQSIESGKTDDGSKLDVVSTEIPQADKERVVIAQSQPDGSWIVLDDFVFSGSDTNDLSHVQLEHRQLEYFDQQERLIRKKALNE
jgi:hypothetical protein